MAGEKRKHSVDDGSDGPEPSRKKLHGVLKDASWPMPDADYEFKDLYSKPPDFKQLALLDPDFAPL